MKAVAKAFLPMLTICIYLLNYAHSQQWTLSRWIWSSTTYPSILPGCLLHIVHLYQHSPCTTGIAKNMAISVPQAIDISRRRSSFFSTSQEYLTGLRGVITLQSFLWLFFHTFVPALTSNDAPGPTYQVVIRKLLSVLFWDETLIYSWFIILSARSISVKFLQDGAAVKFARTVISRPLRIGIPASFALAFSIAIFSTIDTTYIADAAASINNPLLKAPTKPRTALAAFNSIYNLMWVYRDYATQMGNLAWPSHTIWIISVIYAQSYTVYAIMVTLPYTRPGWHFQGLTIFAFGAWWFNNWGWYSATGLFLADVAINPALRSALMRGMQIPSRNKRIPYWAVAIFFTFIGFLMKYIWVAAFPSHINAELNIHPAKHLSDGSSYSIVDGKQPYPRMDNFFVITGILLGLEFSDLAKTILQSKPLMMLGHRSLSKLLLYLLTELY